jgi:hypothetical protein
MTKQTENHYFVGTTKNLMNETYDPILESLDSPTVVPLTYHQSNLLDYLFESSEVRWTDPHSIVPKVNQLVTKLEDPPYFLFVLALQLELSIFNDTNTPDSSELEIRKHTELVLGSSVHYFMKIPTNLIPKIIESMA